MLTLWCSLGAMLPSSAAAQPFQITPRGSTTIAATATDQHGAPFAITGMSGITYMGEADGHHRFLVVLDNSNKVIELAAAFGANGSLSSVSIARGISLTDSRDFEGIAFTGANPPTLLLSEEGAPGVREYLFDDGAFVHAWTVPPVFASRRDNFGFESLTTRGHVVWTANEEALTLDGALSTPSAGSVVRLLKFVDGSAAAQHAYVTEPIHGIAITGSRSGLSDLVLLPGGRLIALERSLALANPPFLSRIYGINLDAATDVSSYTNGLLAHDYTPAAKTLLYSGGLTNLEGLCLGPRLDNGHWVMLGVVDDADPLSNNTLVAFELAGLVEPPACPADWNDSGDLSSQDFFDFLQDFFAAAADFNTDGLVDSNDFFAFLNEFFAGC